MHCRILLNSFSICRNDSVILKIFFSSLNLICFIRYSLRFDIFYIFDCELPVYSYSVIELTAWKWIGQYFQ